MRNRTRRLQGSFSDTQKGLYITVLDVAGKQLGTIERVWLNWVSVALVMLCAGSIVWRLAASQYPIH